MFFCVRTLVVCVFSFLSSIVGDAASQQGYFMRDGIVIATCTRSVSCIANGLCQKGAFLVSDFDGIIGAGTGHNEDDTPSRFDDLGRWQARCRELLTVFQDQHLRGNALVVSSGMCFFQERKHYGLPETDCESQKLLDGLDFYPGVGFYVHQPGDVSMKGVHFPKIAHKIKEIYERSSFVFVDDFWGHAKGVHDACKASGIKATCIWLPHPELHPWCAAPCLPSENDVVVDCMETADRLICALSSEGVFVLLYYPFSTGVCSKGQNMTQKGDSELLFLYPNLDGSTITRVWLCSQASKAEYGPIGPAVAHAQYDYSQLFGSSYF